MWKETESGGAYNQRLGGGVEDTEEKRGTGQVRPQSQAMEAGINLMSHRITFKTGRFAVPDGHSGHSREGTLKRDKTEASNEAVVVTS